MTAPFMRPRRPLGSGWKNSGWKFNSCSISALSSSSASMIDSFRSISPVLISSCIAATPDGRRSTQYLSPGLSTRQGNDLDLATEPVTGRVCELSLERTFGETVEELNPTTPLVVAHRTLNVSGPRLPRPVVGKCHRRGTQAQAGSHQYVLHAPQRRRPRSRLSSNDSTSPTQPGARHAVQA